MKHTTRAKEQENCKEIKLTKKTCERNDKKNIHIHGVNLTKLTTVLTIR